MMVSASIWKRGLLWSYRFIQNHFVRQLIFRWKNLPQGDSSFLDRASGQHWLQDQECFWFHAASVGELEILWPLILLTGGAKKSVMISLFSRSAESALVRLRKTCQEYQIHSWICTYSPWEGEWKNALQQFRPKYFITAKYEAWPDLWISLVECKIPLVLLSASARPSIRLAKRICQFFCGELPELFLFPAIEADISGLRKLFPIASIQCLGETRWDRVYSRILRTPARVLELLQLTRGLKKPWGILGSVWLEDLEVLAPMLGAFSGTVWLVPHRVDLESIDRIECFLRRNSLRWVKTSDEDFSKRLARADCPILLVDEMGYLSELYSVTDWAFVGGGFGVGIHSTIEPALSGIPIAVGPQGVEQFSETRALLRTGQLSILKTSDEALQWMQRSATLKSHREQWMQQAQDQLGASQRIFTAIQRGAQDASAGPL